MTFHKLDRNGKYDDVFGILWEAWFAINGEDLNSETTYTDIYGIERPIHKIDALIHLFYYQGYDIYYAKNNDNFTVAILVCHKFDTVINVKVLYVDPNVAKSKVGRDLINSLGVKKIIFQTRKGHETKAMFETTSKRRKLISEDDKLSTWEMDWG